MNKQRKTSNILNVFQYDETTGAVTLPSTLVLTAPASDDNSTKVGTTAWVRTYVSGLSYQGALTLTVTGTSGAATLVGNTLNIPTYTLVGLGGQAALSGTGFVKISGTTISYDNSTYATQTYVTTAISNLVDSSPATLDTLNELAAALGDDPNFATTVATSIGTKQAQLNGTGFVKVTGTTVSYDNSTYLTTGTASSTYVPYTGATADLVLGANNFSAKRVSVLKSSDGFGGFTSNYLFLQTGSSTTNVGTDGISLLSKPNTRALVINYDIGGTNYGATLDASLLTSGRTYEFPNASGVLALTSNIPSLTGYVPYTGATTAVDLGTNDITSRYVVAAGSPALGGVISMRQDATYLAKGNGYSSIASSTVAFDFFGYTGASTYKNFTLRFDGLTNNTRREYILPDAGGTLALTSNLSSYLPLSGGTLTGLLTGTDANFSSKVLIGAVTGTDSQAKLELIGSGPVGLKIKSSGVNGNNTFLSIESSKEWRFLTNRGDLISGNQGDLIIRNNTDSVNAIILNQNGNSTFSGSVRSKGMSVDGTSGAGFLAQLDGNNSAANGAYIGFVNNNNTRYFISQLDTNNDINYYYFNGSAWSSSIMKLSNDGILSVVDYFLTGINKGIKFDSSGSSGHPEISVDSSVNLSFKNSAGVNNLVLTNGGVATFIGAINAGGAISTTSGLNSSKNIVAGEATPLHLSYSSSDGSGPAVRFGGGQGFWDIQPSSSNQRLSFEWNDTINALSLLSDGRVGITDTNPPRRLSVNFGTSVNDGLMVYGSQRQNTVFQSTGEHCFLYIDSFHNNIFLPRLHFQRSSTTFGVVGLERASNSDSIGAYAESEMVVGTTTTVPFSIQTNSQRRIRVASGGGVEVFNTLSVSGNLTARNFSKFIKTWAPAGSTGSGTSTTYNWADELASVAGNFDSGGYYRGFIRSGNGAHYYGYHFDILVGSIGYGGNSLQFKVQNIVGANSPWAGGCGFPPLGTVDTTNFTHINNPCGEYLELYITKLGG